MTPVPRRHARGHRLSGDGQLALLSVHVRFQLKRDGGATPALARGGQVVNQIGVSRWLKTEQVKAAANSDGDWDEYGARVTLETAARLAQASRVVKQAPDRECGARQDKQFRDEATDQGRQQDVAASPGGGVGCGLLVALTIGFVIGAL